MQKTLKVSFLASAIAILMAGCASDGYVPGQGGKTNIGSAKIETGTPLPGSRYSMRKDAPPEADVDVSSIPNATPRAEPYSRGGNKSPYKVWGKTYHVLETHEGYSETGSASWYGRKFHGHKTSNGEIYDMYGMTAAHKSLPIPSYLKVRNLDNGREVIVRVNDRGPFHSDRIVDLSYAAAKKLGYKDKGTAKVKLTAITVKDSGAYAVPGSSNVGAIKSTPLEDKPSASPNDGSYFVQVGAFSDKERASDFSQDVKARLGMGLSVESEGIGLLARHKVLVGPYASRSVAENYLNTIKRNGFFGAFIVQN